MGKTSPGFLYDVTDKFDYRKSPGWIFGQSKRASLNCGEKYEHYFIQDKDSRPEASNDYRKPNQTRIKFQRSKRVSLWILSKQEGQLGNSCILGITFSRLYLDQHLITFWKDPRLFRTLLQYSDIFTLKLMSCLHIIIY